MKMRLPEGVQCEIEHKNEAADLSKTAEMINQGNYDFEEAKEFGYGYGMIVSNRGNS